MTLKFTVTNTVPKDLDRRIASEMEDWAGLATRRAADELEQKTSDWKDKPEFKSRAARGGPNIRMSVTTTSKIFHFVDKGTKPHRIPKKGKKRLSIRRYGKVVMFANHPGSKAREMSEEALNNMRDYLFRVARERVRKMRLR